MGKRCRRGHDPDLLGRTKAGHCRACIRDDRPTKYAWKRAHDRFTRYGITPEKWDALLKTHGGKCIVCGMPVLDTKVRIDHNHATGEVRGLLCNSCNSGLGFFRDSPELLLRAYNYLNDKGYYGRG